MTTPLRDALAAARKLCEEASAAPWRTAYAYKKESWGLLVAATAPGHQVHSVGNKSGTYPSADLDFIAAARTLLPLALDVVEKAHRYVLANEAEPIDEGSMAMRYIELTEALSAFAKEAK